MVDKYHKKALENMKSRNENLFSQMLKTEKTAISYKFEINKFLDHFDLTFDDLAKKSLDDIQVMTEDWIILRKKAVKRGTILSFINALKHYFMVYELPDLNWKRITKFLPEQEKLSGSGLYTTQDVKQLLESTTSQHIKGIIHLMSCSGVRVGAIPDIQLKHLEKMSFGCYCLTVYPNSKEEYTTFITDECWDSLQKHLDERKAKGQIITPESFLFVNRKGLRLNPQSLICSMSYHVRNHLKREKETNARYKVQTNHAFRKRFNTILKSNDNCNISLSELLLGHSYVKLDEHYFRPTKEQLFSEYMKNLKEFYIDDKYRLAFELRESQEQIEELKQKDNEIAKLKGQIAEIMAHLENVQKLS